MILYREGTMFVKQNGHKKESNFLSKTNISYLKKNSPTFSKKCRTALTEKIQKFY